MKRGEWREETGGEIKTEERGGSGKERGGALPSSAPPQSLVVDLAEHFNDSSLPRAFTVPAVSRLGYRSVRNSFETALEQVSINGSTYVRPALAPPPLILAVPFSLPFDPLLSPFNLHFARHPRRPRFRSRSSSALIRRAPIIRFLDPFFPT